MPKHEISNVRTRGTGAIEKLIFYKTEVSEHQEIRVRAEFEGRPRTGANQADFRGCQKGSGRNRKDCGGVVKHSSEKIISKCECVVQNLVFQHMP